MTDRELLEQALEALDGVEAMLSSMDITHRLIYGEVDKAITNLRERLTQPAQQPLTDEQIIDKTRWVCVDMRWPSTVLDIARAIEAAHGIKGEA